MPKRPKRTKGPSPQVEEFDERTIREEPAGEVIEFSETAAATRDVAQPEDAPPEAGFVPLDESLLKARDELERQMGDFESVAAALSEPSDTPTSGLGNIVGWGVGEKTVGGRYTGELAVKVYVVEKLSEPDIEEDAFVPEEVSGFPTDVEEVGEITADVFTGRYRPAPAGSSVGHPRITAGTIGCLVVRNNRRLCMLSNNHVIANSNDARIGDTILQPGPADGGRNPRDRVGILEAFVPIDFTGSNAVDAALGWTSFRFCSPRHHCYTINPAPLNPAFFMPVRKCGRTTQHTLGLITSLGANIRVRYGARIAFFRNQVQIRGLGGDFSRGGDSGSLVVSAGTRQPVALLFAGGGGFTFANPISAVISALGIQRFLS